MQLTRSVNGLLHEGHLQVLCSPGPLSCTTHPPHCTVHSDTWMLVFWGPSSWFSLLSTCPVEGGHQNPGGFGKLRASVSVCVWGGRGEGGQGCLPAMGSSL